LDLKRSFPNQSGQEQIGMIAAFIWYMIFTKQMDIFFLTENSSKKMILDAIIIIIIIIIITNLNLYHAVS